MKTKTVLRYTSHRWNKIRLKFSIEQLISEIKNTIWNNNRFVHHTYFHLHHHHYYNVLSHHMPMYLGCICQNYTGIHWYHICASELKYVFELKCYYYRTR